MEGASFVLQCLRYWEKGGWLLVPIALVSLALWFYMLRLHARLQDELDISESFEKQYGTRLADPEELEKMRRVMAEDATPFSRMLFHVFTRVRHGLRFEDVWREIESAVFGHLRHDIGLLEALVTSAPLLGLLGTVLGLIRAFGGISLDSASMREMMASGIGQALITTQVGLVVALLGLFGVSTLRRKIRQLEVRYDYLKVCLSMAFRKERV